MELVSTTPARLFGLYPRKGEIAAGSDADIVIWDPEQEHTISVSTHHMRVDYSMFEGFRVKGAARTVLSRGEVVVDGERFVGRAGRGRFLKREARGGAWKSSQRFARSILTFTSRCASTTDVWSSAAPSVTARM